MERRERLRTAFVISCLVATACGGGAGGDPENPDPVLQSVATAVTTSLDAVHGDPSAALAAYNQLVWNTFRDGTNPQDVAGRLDEAVLRAYIDARRWDDLLELARVAPDVTLIPAPAIVGASSRSAASHIGEGLPGCGHTKVYFVNGIMNTYESAIHSAHLLAWLVSLEQRSPEFWQTTSFSLFWNPSGLAKIDALEEYCKWFNFGLSSFSVLPTCGASNRSVEEQAHGSCTVGVWDLVEAVNQWIDQGVPTSDVGTDDATRLMNIIMSDVDNGFTVILVPHSQGNFFVQRALELLPDDAAGTRMKSVGVVALASPANYPDNSEYGRFTDFKLDYDILSPWGLATNLTNEFTNSAGVVDRIDPRFRIAVHSFPNSYVGCLQSRSRIIEAILSTRQSLSNRNCSTDWQAAAGTYTCFSPELPADAYWELRLGCNAIWTAFTIAVEIMPDGRMRCVVTRTYRWEGDPTCSDGVDDPPNTWVGEFLGADVPSPTETSHAINPVRVYLEGAEWRAVYTLGVPGPPIVCRK